MQSTEYTEWVPSGALVKSLFVGFFAYIVIFTIAIFLFVELSAETVYGLFNRKTFLLKDIASCKKSKSSFGRYWGVGVRYSSDGSEAYSASLGDAVEVAPKTGRVFVFSSKKPDQVCEIIKRTTQNGAQIDDLS